MANTFLLGNKFYLKLTVDSVDVMLVCKTDSTINFTNSPVLVRNQCTGDYGVALEGGQKSGSADFTGTYDLTSSPNISAIGLAKKLGQIVPMIWGGIAVGQDIIEVNVQVNNVSISTPNDTEITFSATLDFAGTPVFGTVTA